MFSHEQIPPDSLGNSALMTLFLELRKNILEQAQWLGETGTQVCPFPGKHPEILQPPKRLQYLQISLDLNISSYQFNTNL